MLKILYVGCMIPGGTCRERMNALAAMGHSVVPVDITPYYTYGPRWLQVISHRIHAGPAFRNFNRDIRVAADRESFDWAWIDKGNWVWPHTLDYLRGCGIRRLIHYTPDPALSFHRTRHFVGGVPRYDVLITNKRYELDLYRQHGARDVVWSCTAFSHGIFKPTEINDDERLRFGCDIAFIGHCEPHYQRTLRFVADHFERLAIWGPQWGARVASNPWLKRVFRGPGVWGEDYLKALRCAKIGLGLLTRLAPDQATTRSMEIPAAGTFMLAERTDEHRELFEEGTEAEFFGSLDELRDKLRFYLRDDAAREKIAAAGQRRVMTSGYSYQDRMRELVEHVSRLDA
jgi:spore maturation protein CgeB